MPVPASIVNGVAWPAIPDPTSATLLALIYQFDQSQWWAPEVLREHQLKQLAQLLAQSFQYSPYYRERLGHLVGQDFLLKDFSEFRTIPILTRDQLQDNHAQVICTGMPNDHMPRLEGRSSGSTGKPVNFYHTKVTKVFGRAMGLRSELWHDLDPAVHTATLQLMKKGLPESEYARIKPQKDVFPGGTVQSFPSSRPVSEQLDWLMSTDAEKLVTYPSNLKALLVESRKRGLRPPKLRYIRTLGEPVPASVRQLCEKQWGSSVVDIYSCKEANILALQCPQQDHYHIQAERIILEVLDEHDQPCAPGETGRVVITDLHNFAMPFIRYELGDHAEVGEACSCGRTLPVLKRILGRTRNMMTLPRGGQIWPQVGLASLSALGPIRQMQVVQKTRINIQVRVALSHPMDGATESVFAQAVREKMAALSPEFEVDIEYMNEIPRSASGKYEDFMSMLETP